MDLVIFPHQLFDPHPGWNKDPDKIILIEDSLFFGDWNYPAKFHKQKLWFHRATMKRYQQRLEDEGFKTEYVEYGGPEEDTFQVLQNLFWFKKNRPDKICYADPVDYMLAKRIERLADRLDIEREVLPTPMFLNSSETNQEYRAGKKRWFMADFYKHQRKRLNILVDSDGEPVGGKWSYDDENRKKVPKKLLGEVPSIPDLSFDQIDEEAKQYVLDNFESNYGEVGKLFYPTSHDKAARWLKQFLNHRFEKFGDFEDAIVENESWLWHSVLTPMLNVGLLTPDQIVDATLDHASRNEIPLNSLEGFLRQIIGWREFMRATYEDLGVQMRTSNHWNHNRKMPASFYDGSTGISPVDDTIQRLLRTGYCHHIERLMVLGGFMFLCELDPKAIYKWFMEMFVDSYDWVMVTNVYAMSQHADGGLITTKPYFSGSSYVRKMSNFSKGDWCDTWDGLYWRWIWQHHDELSKNPRWAMMCSMAKKMDKSKRDNHVKVAEEFLKNLI